MKFYIHTTGCKANQWDTQVISQSMKDGGFEAGPLNEADVVIINACTVTGGAERDIRRFINLCRRTKSGSRIIIAGCHGQAYSDRAFGADLVLGQAEKFRIPEFITATGVRVSTGTPFSMEHFIPEKIAAGRTRYFLKIQDGCDRFCSYCIVPYARGTPRSRPAPEIMKIMERLTEKGVKEVVLTGIEISAYNDPETKMGLKALLKRLEMENTPPRIRLSSVDPLFIDDEFMEIMASSKKIMKSIHIPLQSGSDAILKTMGRNYTPKFAGDLLTKLVRAIPSIGIGIDIIAGFPGEDENLFKETLSFINDSPAYYLHVFPFSARPGTVAATMPGALPETIKKERVRLLKELDAEKREAFYNRFTGSVMSIIAEGKIYKEKYMRGYTGNYLPVYIPFEKKLENSLLEVTIEGLQEGLLVGEVLNK